MVLMIASEHALGIWKMNGAGKRAFARFARMAMQHSNNYLMNERSSFSRGVVTLSPSQSIRSDMISLLDREGSLRILSSRGSFKRPAEISGVQFVRAFSEDKNGKGKSPFSWWDKNKEEDKENGRESSENTVGSQSKSESSKKGGGATSSLIRRRRGTIYPSRTESKGDDKNANNVENSSSLESNTDGGNTEDINATINSLMQVQAPHLPQVIMLPYKQRPIFPGFTHPFFITQKEVYQGLAEAKNAGKPYVAMFMEREMDLEEENSAFAPTIGKDSFYDVGIFAQVLQIQPVASFNANVGGTGEASSSNQEGVSDENAPPVGWNVLLRAHRRIELLDIVEPGPPIIAKIAHLKEKPIDSYNPDTIRAYSNELLTTLREVIRLNPMMRDHMHFFSSQRYDVTDPYLLADFAASLTTAEPKDFQEVVEALNLEDRLNVVLLMLKKEKKMYQLQQEISQQVEKKISDNQRKYFLNEQLKQIKQELGLEHDDKESLKNKYTERLEELNAIEPGIPQDAMKVINEELAKLDTLEKNSAEFNMTRSYLDWLTLIPWTRFSEDNFDLEKAKEILERDHYGLSDIKERILEFIAVGKLRGSVQGKILLLVGPPGVGKTSIGKSIASALEREFYRFSVGGLSDVSEIKGHRRTYVGAMPGKMIQCLKITNVSNPLVLIDEIDKLGQGYRGDPASALLELLDPSQNSSFLDHYLDVAVDVSKVLFVCTANVTDSIPGPLLDRMEVLRLSGYDLPEKVAIAQQYLEPRAKKDCGLMAKENQENNEVGIPIPKSLGLEKEAIESLIRGYCREAGVRSLQQHIERIYRKVALKVLKAKESELDDPGKWRIRENDLVDYVGQPRFPNERLYASDNTPPGVVMGLAWTATGGSALYIESTNVKRGKLEESDSASHHKVNSGLFVTGHLGEVMKESAEIAYTHARHKLNEIDPNNIFFEVNRVHMHTPEGATPKDGPSAGVTMTTALISLAMDKPVKPDLAMTGELSLTGIVLPVGGIKEKVIAARRSGVKTIILPYANQKDFDELADYLKEDIEFHYAKTYDDVYKIAFAES